MEGQLTAKSSSEQHNATHFNTSHTVWNELQHTATNCNTLQHTATHCHTLQHAATHCNALQHESYCMKCKGSSLYYNTLQLTVTHCNALQHTATHFNTHTSTRVILYEMQRQLTELQHTATHCITLQHTATHCNTLQHTATHYIMSHTVWNEKAAHCTATHCNSLQHTATHSNTMQHTSTRVILYEMQRQLTAKRSTVSQYFWKGSSLLKMKLYEMTTELKFEKFFQGGSVLQCVAMCCSVLQCVAVCWVCCGLRSSIKAFLSFFF